MKPIFVLAGLISSAIACASLPNPLATDTPYPCPQATAEIFYVDPIPATTDQTSLIVKVTLGNLEEVTIATESGTFVSNSDEIEITLLPGIEHHLEVIGQVREVSGSNGCTYGGYTLHTTVDKNGAPLVIQQTSEAGATPTLQCPQATPEPFAVDPIPATASDTKLLVTVRIGNGESIVIETESGTFTAEGPFSYYQPTEVEITLLPNTVHHLKVTAKVQQFGEPGTCQYGGYTLSTTTDSSGQSLVVEQKSP
jgi:hypothetical protein